MLLNVKMDIFGIVLSFTIAWAQRQFLKNDKHFKKNSF